MAYAGINMYHELLGVKTDVSLTELTAAYRRLALEYHPDRNPGNPDATKAFQDLGNAYDALRGTGKQIKPYHMHSKNSNPSHYSHHATTKEQTAHRQSIPVHRSDLRAQRAAKERESVNNAFNILHFQAIANLQRLQKSLERLNKDRFTIPQVESLRHHKRWFRKNRTQANIDAANAALQADILEEQNALQIQIQQVWIMLTWVDTQQRAYKL